MEIFWPVDRAMGELNSRLPICEVRELNTQFNCNLESSEDSETWFDEEQELELTVVEPTWFFEEV